MKSLAEAVFFRLAERREYGREFVTIPENPYGYKDIRTQGMEEIIADHAKDLVQGETGVLLDDVKFLAEHIGTIGAQEWFQFKLIMDGGTNCILCHTRIVWDFEDGSVTLGLLNGPVWHAFFNRHSRRFANLVDAILFATYGTIDPQEAKNG